jgi:alkylhydroperoxidase family enzyme
VDINSLRVRDGEDGDARLADVASWRDSTLFSEPERVALEVAERMTRTGERIDDALFARLRQHYTEAEIVELTAAIALENFRSKFNPALGVEAQGFCVLPKR